MKQKKQYPLHSTAEPYLRKVRKHKKPYEHKIFGKKILIYPNVMSPKYDWSSRFHIKHMPNQNGKSFLEVGSGCGVISLFAHFQGAKNIVAVDINPNALENTKKNFENYKANNTEVFHSDVFEQVKGKFDTITFAAPYHGTKPKDKLECGVSDPGYKALRAFMSNAGKYLAKNGQIVLGFSNTGNVDLLNTLIIENKFEVKKRHEETKKGWTAYLYILEPIEFDTKKQAYIYEDDHKWFKEYKELILSGKVLKVGVGLGYASSFISLYNKKLVNLERKKPKESLARQIKTYVGNTLPYSDNQFETVICLYTLHHAEASRDLLKELMRVTKKNLVIVEETYSNPLSKIILIFNDYITNHFAKQAVKIHPKSYFRTGELQITFSNHGFDVIKHRSFINKLFNKEGFVLRKGKN